MFPSMEEITWTDITPAEFDLFITENLRGIRQQMAELEAMEASYLDLIVRAQLGKKHQMIVKYQMCEEVGALRVMLQPKGQMGF